MEHSKRKYSQLPKLILKKTVLLVGVFSLLFFILSFTETPYWGIYYLGNYKNALIAESENVQDSTKLTTNPLKQMPAPRYIIMMGSSGMPSKNALLSCYHTAFLTRYFPKSNIIVALPEDTLKKDNHLYKIKKELQLRGVENPIMFEPEGINTYQQTENIAQMIDKKASILLVNMPELIYRSAKCLEKQGFENISTWATTENNLDEDFLYAVSHKKENLLIKKIEQNHQLRYQIWNHMKYELTLIREYMAISYYYVNNWI